MAYPSFETLDISVGLNYYKTRLASQFIYYEDAIDSEVTGAAERKIAVIRPRLIGSTFKTASALNAAVFLAAGIGMV